MTESAADMLILNIFDPKPFRVEIKIESNTFVYELKYARTSLLLPINFIL